MRGISRFLLGLLSTGLLTLGTGCMRPPTVVRTPTVESVAPGEGVVIVSLTANTARTGQFDALQVRRKVAAGQPAQDFRLVQSSAGLSRDTSLFVGALPPGEYGFTRLHSGTQFVMLGEKAQELLGSFQVGPDETVDLGRLVLTGINDRVIVGRSARVLDNADLLKLATPDLLALARRKTASGWLAPRHDRDRVEDYARATVVGADGLKELEGGYVAAGSRLGMVVVRNPQGRWAGLPTGTLASILDLVPEAGEDRRLVAVGEFRTLVRVGRDWKATPLDPGDLPPGNLFFIAGSEARGWVVGHQAGTVLTFFRSARLEGGQWQALRREEVKDSIWSGRNRVWAWPTAGGVAYATSFGGLHAYDAGTGQWSQVGLPKDCNILEASIQDRWSLLTSPGGGFGGVFSSILVSGDEGRSWSEMEGPFKAKRWPPCFLPGGRVLMQGGITTAQLQASPDGGKTWAPVRAGLVFQARLVVTPTQGVFAINDGGASYGYATIYHSGDGGETWKLESTTFDQAAYDSQHPAKR